MRNDGWRNKMEERNDVYLQKEAEDRKKGKDMQQLQSLS